jgi:hypothetical protein
MPIAWESHQLAKSDIYGALTIPERPCMLEACDPATTTPITLSQDCVKREAPIAGHQLARARYRLAALLDQISSTISSPHGSDSGLSSNTK